MIVENNNLKSKIIKTTFKYLHTVKWVKGINVNKNI